MEKPKINTQMIEYAVVQFLDYRRNFIIPNASYGLYFSYEADLLVIRPSNALVEIEIKTSYSDFLADFRKRHYHDDRRVKEFYYALPDYLIEKCLPKIPPGVGIISVSLEKMHYGKVYAPKARYYRKAKPRKNVRALQDHLRTKIGELMMVRYWSQTHHFSTKSERIFVKVEE